MGALKLYVWGASSEVIVKICARHEEILSLPRMMAKMFWGMVKKMIEDDTWRYQIRTLRLSGKLPGLGTTKSHINQRIIRLGSSDKSVIYNGSLKINKNRAITSFQLGNKFRRILKVTIGTKGARFPAPSRLCYFETNWAKVESNHPNLIPLLSALASTWKSFAYSTCSE